ncbi:hypothetical protein Sjap_024733 [Stephania japonica]|uniref:DNA repair protein RAD4 n=1 Tax=Stephania japonica TaxID=461633 RepID=A0AAP0EDW7_9MAGN
MRTRNQSKKRSSSSSPSSPSLAPSRGKNVIESGNDSDRRISMKHQDNGDHIEKPEEVIPGASECTYSHRLPEDRSEEDGGHEAEKEVSCSTMMPENVQREEKVDKNVFHTLPEKEDTDESDWEDGFVSVSDTKNFHSDNMPRELIVEFSDLPSSSRKKPIRRASAEEKELAELAHKVHLLCLLARGRLVDNACDDPLIQASLLSLVPRHLLKAVEVPKLTADNLTLIVNWFHNYFPVKSSNSSEKPFKRSLASALENYGGTPEEVAALSVSLFRALNLTTRLVCTLDAISLKPDGKRDADMAGYPNKNGNSMGTGIFDSPTLMVDKPNQASTSVKTCSSKTGSYGDITDERSHIVPSRVNKTNSPSKAILSKYMPDSMLNDSELDSSVCNSDDTTMICSPVKAGGPKRKGDLEFELEMERALSATAAAVADRKLSSDLNDFPGDASDICSPSKRIKRIKSEESPSQGTSTAIGSRKIGAPLYWAEIFCSGENLTGKWVHVDVANGIIDGEAKVEAASIACRKSLRYVVAFAGHGAKDVTRRYCTKWYKIAPKRVNSHWWDAVLAPLRELEARATGDAVYLDSHQHNTSNELEEKPSKTFGSVGTSANGTANSTSVEDFVLSCRSSIVKHDGKRTEKCDLNTDSHSRAQASHCFASFCDFLLLTFLQSQAYKNHPLYVIERWLNKYQILHPRGPLLGFCSGHPVFPRTCVQILHTKQRWLRDGLQVKAGESPAKVVKRARKPVNMQGSESGACEEDNDDGSIALYGKWQTEPLNLPCAVNGIVPKNERGQVDVWSEKCLPPGTVHLRLPRVVPVAKRLEINFAPAMVGFEFRNGCSVPVFDGIVVCTEFKDAIMEAHAEEVEQLETEEKKRNETLALSRWYQLLSSIITRQRLNEIYGDGSSSDIHRQKDDKQGTTHTSSSGDARVSNDECHDRFASKHSFKVTGGDHEHHEHVFPIEDQSFDEENSTRTKRCPCGFSVQVEEL